MKNTLIGLFYLITLLCLPAIARTAYVYDQAKLWSRTGPSAEFKVFIQLRPGTKLEVLSENAETGYTQVRDSKAREYWIKNEYLTPTPTANVLLRDALKQIEQNKKTYQIEIQNLTRQIAALQPHQASNQKLVSKIAQLTVELEQLTLANSALRGGFDRDLYFSGGITVLVGLFLGWVFALRGRKRDTAWH